MRARPRSESSTRYADVYRGVDFRKNPERYRVGRGEQGVLIAEPYKSELLPLWRFRTEAVARVSAAALWRAFLDYRRARDFVGMDMARKFLQMGFTRARRYANHRTGRKWSEGGESREKLPLDPDGEKARAATVFLEYYRRAEKDRVYAAWRRKHVESSRAYGAGVERKKATASSR